MAKTTKVDNFWINFWKWFGDYLLTVLKKNAVQSLFKLLFKNAAFGGIRLWLARLVVDVAWNYIGEPIAKLAIRKGLLVYDTTRGEIQYKKLMKAKAVGDESRYDDIIDDV